MPQHINNTRSSNNGIFPPGTSYIDYSELPSLFQNAIQTVAKSFVNQQPNNAIDAIRSHVDPKCTDTNWLTSLKSKLTEFEQKDAHHNQNHEIWLMVNKIYLLLKAFSESVDKGNQFVKGLTAKETQAIKAIFFEKNSGKSPMQPPNHPNGPGIV